MPRSKVDSRSRRRVAQACESCKKRKAKCNGVLPCDECKARSAEGACRYSSDSRLVLRDAKLTRGPHDSRVRLELAGSVDESSAAIMSPSPRQVDVPVAVSSSSSKGSQMLKDSKGKFIYAGESASLSFLETVRSAVQAAVGPCAFVNEPARNLMMESTPKIHFETAKEPSLDLATARSLASQSFLAVSGILDLFDPPWLMDQLQDWVEQPSKRSKSTSAVIHLALAIGSQAGAQGDLDELLAEQCFAYGRQLTMFNLVDDPSLETIQAVLLITYYMIAACQYNAAFINLGMAARAAYTLGIHLHETNAAFGGDEGLSRERAWKSLRVCDLFLAASLGRPPATSEAASNVAWAPIRSLSKCEGSGVTQVFSAMFRICNVVERVLVEVYAEKAVSLELAKSISRQHRHWAEELPRMLMVDGLEESDAGQGSVISPRSTGLFPRPGSSIVHMAYYYSIILLTRPFLTFQVCHPSEKETQATDSSSSEACLNTYSDACVNSAIKGIDIAHEYVFELNTPRRQPLVVNSVFTSALCLGLAYLDTSGRRKWPMDPSLDRAIKILSHLGRLNSQSARYAGICRQLKEAVTIYATRRDDTLLQENEQVVRSIFGDIGASSKGQFNNEGSRNEMESPRRPIWSMPANGNIGELMTPPPFDFSITREESMLPISGGLHGNIASLSHRHGHSGSDVEGAPHSCLAGNAVDSLSGYFLDQDVPLFPLTSYISPEPYFKL
ncbi:hypothetical protein B0J13DRAFT_528571 [Dactylonectria estremocensis]|uniref:Zn(2)-C6 fungal-type domain-containing protein n=1 Tax=Dactylonectria estremocensis TaxID=1079267 RepID=A0A9P9IXD6_9HYPO|nr:hypothetical protein B0J13DRAFT_528571 [Dactylonectria estremocensis]